MDVVTYGRGHGTEKIAVHAPGGTVMELNEGKLGRAVDRHKQAMAALTGAGSGHTDMETAG